VTAAVSSEPSFVKAKVGRRVHTTHHKHVLEQRALNGTIHVAEDMLVRPDLQKMVPVTCQVFRRRPKAEWILKRTLLLGADNQLFPIPNLLITSASSKVMVANRSAVPQVLRKGEIIGFL
jgi:hypothetical protein